MRASGIAAAALAAWGVCAPLRATAPADDFETLYGKEFARVRQTPDKADDVHLAGKLLAAARGAGDRPALLAVLCEKAHELGSSTVDGFGPAAAAMNLLAGALPDRKADCRQKVLDLFQRNYAVGRATGNSQAADAFIDGLLLRADETATDGDHAAAVEYLRRAANVAGATGSTRRAKVQQALAAALADLKLAHELALLAGRLAADPNDLPARERLISLYLLERNAPAAAAKFLNPACAEQLRTYVPLARKEIGSLDPAAALQLGDWYRLLSEKASPAAQVALLHRAKDYYEFFLARHAAEDLAYSKAALALEKVMAALAKRNATVAPAARAADYWPRHWSELAARLPGGAPAQAADEPQIGYRPGQEGWTVLFDGKSLRAWEQAGRGWTVEKDGTLARAGPAGGLWTRAKFKDFLLDLEFKLAANATSGVLFRVADRRRPLQTGLQVRLANSRGNAFAGRADCGAILDIQAPRTDAVKPPGEWNRLVVLCHSTRVLAVLNGVRVIDMDLARWTRPGLNPDGSRNRLPRAAREMTQNGYVGLADAGRDVWFRNIRIRELDPWKTPPELEPPR